jgi:purine-binding chemotaxis protein CheW
VTGDDILAFRLGRRRFGLKAGAVREVFHLAAPTPVPLAPRFIVGLMNQRGRVITLICARRLLQMQARAASSIVVGFDVDRDGYGLIVDAVEGVISPDPGPLAPPHDLPAAVAALSTGNCRVDGRLVTMLDVARLIDFSVAAA